MGEYLERNGRVTMVQNSQELGSSAGLLARSFAHSLAPLTLLLALRYLLRLRAPLRSFVCSLAHSFAHFAHSRAHGTVNDWMARFILSFFSILAHSAPP